MSNEERAPASAGKMTPAAARMTPAATGGKMPGSGPEQHLQ